jgi:hypothetical protein
MDDANLTQRMERVHRVWRIVQLTVYAGLLVWGIGRLAHVW